MSSLVGGRVPCPPGVMGTETAYTNYRRFGGGLLGRLDVVDVCCHCERRRVKDGNVFIELVTFGKTTDAFAISYRIRHCGKHK